MGSGLGLSISKQFVDRHNGKLWVESDLGVGSTFAFKLPISPFAPPASRAGRWLHEDWLWLERTDRQPVAESPFRRRLVVCDATRKAHAFFQRGSDHVEVVNFDDPAQLAENARAYPPHAVVLVHTDAGELWDQIERLKQQLPDTPIIGYCVPRVVDRVTEAGVTGYLVKPITRAVLAEAMRGLCRSVNSVLIVDDDPDVRQLLTRMLASLDSRLEVTAIAGGAEALAWMHHQPPDLLLLDIVLPATDGWVVLEQKNQDPRLRDIPVLIISAQDPNDQPLTSEMLVATIGRGVSGERLLSCALGLSSILVRPDTEPDPVPG
jgi:CheY-like chemotaxis protein